MIYDQEKHYLDNLTQSLPDTYTILGERRYKYLEKMR